MQWHLTRGQEIVFAIDGLNRLITICLTQYMDNFFASIERLFREYFSWKRVRNTIEHWVFVLDIYFRLHCYTQVTASRSKTATAIALPKTQFSSHRYFFFYMKNFSVTIRRGLGQIGHLVSIMAIVVVLGDLLLSALIGWAPFILIKLLFWIGNGFNDG